MFGAAVGPGLLVSPNRALLPDGESDSSFSTPKAVPPFSCSANLTIFNKLGGVVLAVTLWSVATALMTLAAALLMGGPTKPGCIGRGRPRCPPLPNCELFYSVGAYEGPGTGLGTVFKFVLHGFSVSPSIFVSTDFLSVKQFVFLSSVFPFPTLVIKNVSRRIVTEKTVFPSGQW